MEINAEFSHYSVSANGTAYELIGSREAPVVVLVHGLGVNRHMWRDFVNALKDQYCVLYYDLSGHGDSQPPKTTVSLNLFATQLRQLLDELEIDRCTVIGFSLGGMINRRLAMDYDDRINALVILNSPHERDPEEQRILEERVAETVQGGPQATLQSSIERWFTAEYRNQSPEVIDEVRDWILANNPNTYSQCRQVLAKGVKELIRPQRPIDIPTLVITCENDRGSTPAMSYGIAKEIENSRVIIVRHLQHLGLMEQPLAFLEPIKEFLDQVER